MFSITDIDSAFAGFVLTEQVKKALFTDYILQYFLFRVQTLALVIVHFVVVDAVFVVVFVVVIFVVVVNVVVYVCYHISPGLFQNDRPQLKQSNTI